MPPPTLLDCLHAAIDNEDLVREFDRLSGTHLSKVHLRSPLDAMIDEATGRDADAIDQFVAFVIVCIWVPLRNAGAAR